jgi:general secretion pathway protein A
MYLKHWGLSESPFRTAFDPRHYFDGSTQEEALARMQFLAMERRRLGLLLGESGSGKTLLLHVLRQGLEATGAKVALVSILGITADEFAPLVCDGLKLSVSTPANAWQALTVHINENRLQRLNTVFLLDDVDAPGNALRDQIARLVQLDSATSSRLTVVLALASEHLSGLGQRLLELAELRIDLEPWNRDETARYIRCALETAGSTRPIFDELAIDRLYELAGGMPRRIKQLADLALLAGAGQQLGQINSETVEAATYELGVVAI